MQNEGTLFAKIAFSVVHPVVVVFLLSTPKMFKMRFLRSFCNRIG